MMSEGVLGSALQSYQPIARMQEKAAQLRAELDMASKGDRHAQFKSISSKSIMSVAGAAQGPAPATGLQSSSPSRRLLRTLPSTLTHSTHVHSVSTVLPSASGPYERQASANVFTPPHPPRLSSRRVSNASGGATDTSAEDLRTTTSGRSPSSRRSSRPLRSSVARDLPPSDYAAAISRQNQLEDTVAELEDRVRDLAVDNERRQESYMRREAVLQEEVARLEDQLRKSRGEQPLNPNFGRAAANIRELHGQVVSQIEELLTAQAATLRSEEHSTLRRFTHRLNELETAVAAERAKGAEVEDVDSAQQIQALRKELDNTQQIAQILDKKHSVLSEENSRLRAQFKLQEEDREYLIKQTVALKKENSALRNQLSALLTEIETLTRDKEELEMATAGGPATSADGGAGGGGNGSSSFLTLTARPESAVRPSSAVRPASRNGGVAAGGSGASGPSEGQIAIKIQRYEDIIESLKRLLEAERRRTKQARAAHTLELQQRTGLQAVVRQCVEDIRERRKALEAEAQREQGRQRPSSALRQSPATSLAHSARPLSASPASLLRRPASATPGGGGGFSPHGAFGGMSAVASAFTATDTSLSASERQELIQTLLGNEQVLRALFDRAFPGVSPHSPSDPYLDKFAAWQEQRDAQVAANAKVLAAAKNAVLPHATAIKESTPGGMLLKEAANRPWVLNVDAMLSEFLSGGGHGGGGGTGTAALSSKSLGGMSATASGGGAGS